MDTLGPKKRSLAALLAWIASGSLIVYSQETRNWLLVFLALWGAYASIRSVVNQHQTLLHPPPEEYALSPQVAFMAIRNVLAETSYGTGDTWHVAVADTQAGRIVAHLRYCDERTFIEGDMHGHVNVRKERHRRFITLEALIKEAGDESVSLELNYSSKAEDGNVLACHRVISSTSTAIRAALGSG